MSCGIPLHVVAVRQSIASRRNRRADIEEKKKERWKKYRGRLPLAHACSVIKLFFVLLFSLIYVSLFSFVCPLCCCLEGQLLRARKTAIDTQPIRNSACSIRYFFDGVRSFRYLPGLSIVRRRSRLKKGSCN